MQVLCALCIVNSSFICTTCLCKRVSTQTCSSRTNWGYRRHTPGVTGEHWRRLIHHQIMFTCLAQLIAIFFFMSFHSFWNRHHCHLFYWSITGASLAICSYRKTKNRCFVTSADARRSEGNNRRRRHGGLSGDEGGCLLLMHTTSRETFRVILRAKVNVFSVAEVEGRAACGEVEAWTKHPPRLVRVSFVPAQVVEIIDSFLLVLFLSHFLSRRCCLVSGVFLLSHSCFYEPLFSRPFAWRGSAKKSFNRVVERENKVQKHTRTHRQMKTYTPAHTTAKLKREKKKKHQVVHNPSFSG